MVPMCPHCNSRKFRVLRARSWKDRVAEYLGSFRLRCADCGTNYRKTWSPKDYLYAKCPKCLRTDLTFWSPQYYRPPLVVSLKLAFGARRLRCEVCRHNFASFRLLRTRYRRPSSDAVVTGERLGAENGRG